MSKSTRVFVGFVGIIFFWLPCFIFLDVAWMAKPFNGEGVDEVERMVLLIYFAISVFVAAVIASKVDKPKPNQ